MMLKKGATRSAGKPAGLDLQAIPPWLSLAQAPKKTQSMRYTASQQQQAGSRAHRARGSSTCMRQELSACCPVQRLQQVSVQRSPLGWRVELRYGCTAYDDKADIARYSHPPPARRGVLRLAAQGAHCGKVPPPLLSAAGALGSRLCTALRRKHQQAFPHDS